VPGELAPIVHRLNALLARLEAAFAREKAFTADVAHELRTPLAGLRTTMEVSLAKTRDAADHRRALAESLTIAEQMQQMIENLLELARAEAGQLHVAQDDVDLVPLLRDRFTPFDQRAQQRRLRVQWSLPPSCHARADRTKIALVLSNIFDNATTHADAPGEVRIELKSENGAARLRVSNPASRLSPGDAEHVFQRYWRGDAARSTIDHQHHHGLGLPLCKQLVHLMGGDIEVGIAEEGEFEVSVTLPREVSVTLPRNEPRSSTSDTP
jgi:two-component system sensor histidine kinase QseC